MMLNVVNKMEDGCYVDMGEMDALPRSSHEYVEVEGDEYGGMPPDLYHDICEYKRTGTMPSDIKTRPDRSGPSHWRARCAQFTLADDGETLLFLNRKVGVGEQPKVVIKKGEVRKVLQRIHEIIGHLGTKRTQIVCQRKLYWRSTQQDVKTYVAQCDFCNQKKAEGKKIVKAPLDVSSEAFDIRISIKDRNSVTGDRLEFTLDGYNEQDVKHLASTRMRSYTFKETSSDYRTRLGSSFRRQPYMKRDRLGQFSNCFMVPLNDRRLKNGENEFIEVYEKDGVLYEATDFDAAVMEEEVEQIPQALDEIIIETQKEDIEEEKHGEKRLDDEPTSSVYGRDQQMMETVPLQLGGVPLSTKRRGGMSQPMEMDESRASTSRFTKDENDFRKKRQLRQRVSMSGIAARFSEAVCEDDHLRAGDLIGSYDPNGMVKPEMAGLPPICLMPSMDPSVAQLQKDLLNRQIEIQKLQLKYLQERYETLPMQRYPVTAEADIPHEGEIEVDVIEEEDGRENYGEEVATHL